jgi:glycosyltransferase involved in cell wall biosynthesis
VPHGNAPALAARMLELAADPARVATLGAAARRFAEGLTWDRAADLTEAWMAGMVAGHGA